MNQGGNWPKAKVFYFICLAFIAGIAIASFLNFAYLQYELIYFSLLMFFLVLVVVFWKNFKLRFAALLGLFLFLGIWRYAIVAPLNTPDKAWYYNGQTVLIQGVVAEDVDVRERTVKLLIKARHLVKDGITRPLAGQVLVTCKKYSNYRYGDSLELKCQLESPEPFSGFRYDRYLARHDVYSVCYYPQISVLGHDQGKAWRA